MSELNRDEIIKALECCYTNTLSCIDCPFQATDKFFECSNLVHSAVALIKELTEENANWEAIAEGYRKQFEDCAEERVKLTEENERLKTELRQTQYKFDTLVRLNDEWAEKCERLKKYYEDGEKYLGYSIAYNIDQATKVTTATDNKCVACGETIPEGRQVCPGCEGGKRDAVSDTEAATE